MPELPDITLYIERLTAKLVGQPLLRRQLLADRSVSRLLKDDWPKTLSELEERALVRGLTPSELIQNATAAGASIDSLLLLAPTWPTALSPQQ